MVSIETVHPLKTEKVEVPYKRRYVAAGIAGRVIGNQIRKSGHTNVSRAILNVTDRVGSRLKSKEALSTEKRSEISDTFAKTKFWHGTGRYQYRDGKPVDILEFIAKNGRLQPQYDALDLTGPMASISLAPSRMYSRAYADMHRNGAAEPERFGSSVLWAWMFLGDTAVELARESKVWKKSSRQDLSEHLERGGAVDWYKKVSSSYMGTMKIFRVGSDIPGNYPILFGIKADTFDPIDTSRSIGIHEIRSLQPISLEDDVTHLEVPREHIKKTQEILAANDRQVQVLAIEDCERYVSEIPISDLILGNAI